MYEFVDKFFMAKTSLKMKAAEKTKSIPQVHIQDVEFVEDHIHIKEIRYMPYLFQRACLQRRNPRRKKS